MHFSCSVSLLIFAINFLQFFTVIYSSKNQANVRLFVEGNGFHRNFTYEVKTQSYSEKCYISLNLKLPAALYVNADELAELRRTKKNLICSIGENDVESFAEKSLPQAVTVCSVLNRVIHLTIPIHQRYHYAGDKDKYKNVNFPSVELYFGCQDILSNLEPSDVKLCSPCESLAKSWHRLPYNFQNKTYVWQIPVGQTNHSRIVVFITLLTTFIGAIFILKTIWKMEFADVKED